MFGSISTALRFFLLGLGIGFLTAPRRGEETRRLLGIRLEDFGDWWQGAERRFRTPTPTERMEHDTTQTAEMGYRPQSPQA